VTAAGAADPASIRIPREVLDAIMAHARAESPNECCGLLLGRASAIVAAHRARNELTSPARYRIRPEDHFAAIRAARRQGLEVVGAYHSHPASPPVPSRTDLDEALDAPFVYLIAGREARDEHAVRAWRLSKGNFVPVPLVTLQ
jgi:proteasome lid subunit RPN8/RPN11